MMEKIKEISSEVLYTVYEEVTCLYFQLKVKCKRSCKHNENKNKKSRNSSEASSDETLTMIEDKSNYSSSMD